MSETSIAEAKNQLTRLIHQAEGGEPVHITRRGKHVAVLLSADQYTRLCQGKAHYNFWDLIEDMWSDQEFRPIDWTFEEVDSWRDRRHGRDFEWSE
jgi:prevent-host-death family protein